MNIILFDNNRENYYPLSYTRPISIFRVGILTIKEKWEKYYDSVSIKTADYLTNKFPVNIKEDNLWIDASILPSKELITEFNTPQKKLTASFFTTSIWLVSKSIIFC